MYAGFYCLSDTRGPLVYFVGAALCGVGYQIMAVIPGTHVLAAAFKHRGLPFGLYFTSGSAGGVANQVFLQRTQRTVRPPSPSEAAETS